MSHPKFLHIGNLDDKVIEECSEVIQAIVKIKRFGIDNFHPDRPESNNRDEVRAEIADLRDALDRYVDSIKEQPHDQPH